MGEIVSVGDDATVRSRIQWYIHASHGGIVNDLTYEFQRMVSRRAEIQAATKSNGSEVAWAKYSHDHGLTKQRFNNDLSQLRLRFDGIGSGRDPKA